MFNLDPGKMLLIAVIAVILLGPDRLPHFARQVGGAWRSFNEMRQRLESSVRTSIPDLPSSGDVARLMRSPTQLLNHLSAMAPDEGDATRSKSPAQEATARTTDGTAAPRSPERPTVAAGDPSLN